MFVAIKTMPDQSFECGRPPSIFPSYDVIDGMLTLHPGGEMLSYEQCIMSGSREKLSWITPISIL